MPVACRSGPFVPIMGIIISLALMLGLNGKTWIRLVVWLIIGMVIYYFFSNRSAHSRGYETIT